jgi:adenosylhomocysteinase
MSTVEDRASAVAKEIGSINAFFPLLPQLGNQWAARRPFDGKIFGLNLHLTTLTATLLRELGIGGGTYIITAANPATTDLGVVQYLRNQGFTVYTGGDMNNRHDQLLSHKPDYIVDIGCALIEALITRHPEQAKKTLGAIEITRSGVDKLGTLSNLPFPVINVNDGLLKNAIENRHGVGDGVWSAISALTGVHLSGRRALVIGYGPVGKGIAAYARAAGMFVEVVEADPVRKLFAHYDGFPTPRLNQALERAKFIVTATGKGGVMGKRQIERSRHGVIFANAGKDGHEIDVSELRLSATTVDHISEHVVRYHFENGKSATLLGNGHPLNIVMNSGSHEPVLLHFGVVGLTLEYLLTNELENAAQIVPIGIERQAAQEALFALEI